MADGGAQLKMQFKPDPENTRVLRDAFGRFASGVTIVTAPSDDGPVGITANSFTSLSLDPPLLLWSPATQSRRCRYYEEAKHFAIHVLSAEQKGLCAAFSNSAHAFDALEMRLNDHGVPLIENCLARFECRTHAIYPGGDHKIIVGEIEEVQISDGNALAFFAGQLSELCAK